MIPIVNWTMAVLTLLVTINLFIDALSNKSPHFPWHEALMTAWMALYCIRFVICALNGSIAARLAVLAVACIISVLRILAGKSRVAKLGGIICLICGLLTMLADVNIF